MIESLIKPDEVTREDAVIIKYGLMQTFRVLIYIVSSFMISICLGVIAEFILFLAIFWPLRMYGGGYHASSPQKCFLLSVTVTGLFLALVNTCDMSQQVSVIASAVFAIILYISIPGQNKRVHLDELERSTYRKRGRRVLIVEGIFFMVSIGLECSVLYTLFTLSFGLMVILIFLGKVFH